MSTKVWMGTQVWNAATDDYIGDHGHIVRYGSSSTTYGVVVRGPSWARTYVEWLNINGQWSSTHLGGDWRTVPEPELRFVPGEVLRRSAMMKILGEVG